MNRTELINYLINQRYYTRYLEIGVYDEQHNFALINCNYKVGVDLKPVSTFKGTSDEFFAQNREEFDLIFIDGIHTEMQTLTDIGNACRSLTPGGAIVLHDCMPPDAWHQRELEDFHDGENWNGTVWKAVLKVFNQSRYKCTLLDTDWGCGVIDTAQSQVPVRRHLPEELSYELHYVWLLNYKTSVAAYLRENVKVFYHLACINNWQEVFEEQMMQLQKNGFQWVHLTVLGKKEDLQAAKETCEKHNIRTHIVFHAPELTWFEMPALLAIEEYARQNEGFVLYLHSKGVSNPNDPTKVKWRKLMMRELIENWDYCMLQLLCYEAIGVNWRDMPPISHFSGNFWYASTKYLRKLADFKHYYDNPRYKICNPIPDKRLGCEFWISSGTKIPQVLSLSCKNVDFCTTEFWKNK